MLILFYSINLFSQETWHYPDGNLEGTKRAKPSVDIQNIKDFVVKWKTADIRGDVSPLIGNIVQNDIPNVSTYEPLEICALIGDEIVLYSGTGKIVKKQKLPEFAQHIRSFTVLFDSNQTAFDGTSRNTCLIGSESIEYHNPAIKENRAHSYIFGYDEEKDSVVIVRRLTIDLKDYAPNVSASIKPFMGRRVNGKLVIYAIVDMSKPLLSQDDPYKQYPFFRGYTQFIDNTPPIFFPMPDIGDSSKYRIHVAGDVGLYQPSVLQVANNFASVLLPYQAVDTSVRTSLKNYTIYENVSGANFTTNVDSTYLLGFNITNNNISGNFSPVSIIPKGKRPIIRPLYAKLAYNSYAGLRLEDNYVVVAEQYSGIDGSEGESRLHLYNPAGISLTSENPALSIPPLEGGKNHYWSIAVGDVDGLKNSNHWAPYYPNNPGNEIIVTQSTKEAVYPGSKLFIMRYNNGPEIKKPIPPYNPLFKFDTICTARVNGWLAAVADLDLADNKKDEIILVDGSKLMVLGLRDYEDVNFRLGYPFDTLFVKEFSRQTISNVAIADLEGDGKPEIIVTTHDSTYVIGSIIPNTLRANLPNTLNKTSFCINDTIEIMWHNVVINQPAVSLRFLRYDDNDNFIDEIYLDSNVYNNSDTILYHQIADERFFEGISGKRVRGRFVIEGLDNPDLLNDTTVFIDINLPELYVNSTFPPDLRVGDMVNISANVGCVDYVDIYYSVDAGENWDFASSVESNNDLISYDFIVPCLEDAFSCTSSIGNNPRFEFMLISNKNGVSDSTYINNIEVKSKLFYIGIAPKESANPSINISWDVYEIGTFPLAESTMQILASRDYGTNFEQVAEVSASEGQYTWEIPCDLPNEVVIRLCLDNGCYRVDTLLTDVAAKYVNIIAPNPFNPNIDNMEFVYQVPEELTVTMNIYDQSNRIVKNIARDVHRQPCIIYTELWDGTTGDGSLASNGLYYLIVELSNGRRDVYQVFLAK